MCEKGQFGKKEKKAHFEKREKKVHLEQRGKKAHLGKKKNKGPFGKKRKKTIKIAPKKMTENLKNCDKKFINQVQKRSPKKVRQKGETKR